MKIWIGENFATISIVWLDEDMYGYVATISIWWLDENMLARKLDENMYATISTWCLDENIHCKRIQEPQPQICWTATAETTTHLALNDHGNSQSTTAKQQHFANIIREIWNWNFEWRRQLTICQHEKRNDNVSRKSFANLEISFATQRRVRCARGWGSFFVLPEIYIGWLIVDW